jgi:hypothetical protein
MARYLPAPRDPGRSDDAVLVLLASRLTERDRWLIRLLWEHHVFTTPQITQLAYPNQDRARHGMLRLARLGVIESLRVLLPPGHGSAPLHHFLGSAGARVLAAERGMPFAELGYRRDRTLAWAYSSRLTHLVGVNGLFTGLVAASRHYQFSHLDQWWSEQRCAETWGGYARPDGYGRWFEDGAHLDFFLEYDTGTEPLGRVVKKLRGYAELAAADGVTTPVLIWTSTATREVNLHRQLTGAPVPVATASAHAVRDNRQGPAGPIWLPTGQHDGTPRLRLITLARYAHTDRPEGEIR